MRLPRWWLSSASAIVGTSTDSTVCSQSAAVMAVLAVVVPEHTNSGAGYVGVRMSLFATLFLILWVCTQLSSLQGRVRTAGRGMLAVAAVVAVAIPIVRIPALHHFSAQLEQIEGAAACLPLHSTMIQVSLDDGRNGWSARMAPTVSDRRDHCPARSTGSRQRVRLAPPLRLALHRHRPR